MHFFQRAFPLPPAQACKSIDFVDFLNVSPKDFDGGIVVPTSE